MRTLLRLILLWLTVFIVGKLAFITFCHGSETLSVVDVLAVVWHGLPMDLSTIVYLIVLPGAVLWLCANVPAAWRWLRWLLITVNSILAFAVVACIVGDIALFPFWDFKLDATIWTYIDRPADAVASVSTGFVLLHVTAAIVGTVLVAWLLALIVNAVKPRRQRLYRNIIDALVVVLLFVVMRGGITESTMNVGNAYFSDRQFLNHAAVNPAFSLLASTQKAERFDQYYRAMSESEVERTIDGLYPISNSGTAAGTPMTSLLRSQNPNILLIFWEGCGGEFTDIIGHRKGITPCLDSMAQEGVFFDNCYANSFRTDRGTLSTLSGHLAFPVHTLMKMAARVGHLPSIARTLHDNGYHTAFTYGGDINFTNMKGYLMATGFEHVKADKNFPLAARRSAKWGVADSLLFEHLFRDLSRGSSPFFHAALTLSSHEPWDVPGYDENAPEDESRKLAFQYTDRCLGRFVDRLRATAMWNNLLIIILPDHGIFFEDVVSRQDLRLYHIPMVWIGGAVKGAARVPALMNQSDLPATLFGQMGLPHDDFPWSRDVLSSDYGYPFTYSSFNDGFILSDTTGVTVWDNKGDYITEDTDARSRLGLAIQQRSYDQLHALGLKD